MYRDGQRAKVRPNPRFVQTLPSPHVTTVNGKTFQDNFMGSVNSRMSGPPSRNPRQIEYAKKLPSDTNLSYVVERKLSKLILVCRDGVARGYGKKKWGCQPSVAYHNRGLIDIVSFQPR